MSAMWNRTLVYLGLREEPDEIYDDLPARFVPEDDPYAEHAPDRGASRRREVVVDRRGQPGVARELALAGAAASVAGSGTPRRGAAGDQMEDNVRPLRAADAGGTGTPRAASRVAQIEVTAFDDVEAVGARYRTGQAVLFELSGASPATARRVVDFVAGLTYALRGQLTKVGSRAFLLQPDGVTLSAEERQRLVELGYRLPQAGSTA